MEYTLIRNPRRKHIVMSVDLNGTLIVKAPKYMSEKRINAFILDNRKWIKERQEETARRNAEIGPIKTLSEYELENLKQEARDWFVPAVSRYAGIIGVSYGRVTVRCQCSRWGSCSRNGNLSFNCLLMLAPEDVRQYVIVHELCHRIEMNHSGQFWNHVMEHMPDYREKKKWLSVHGQELLQRVHRL